MVKQVTKFPRSEYNLSIDKFLVGAFFCYRITGDKGDYIRAFHTMPHRTREHDNMWICLRGGLLQIHEHNFYPPSPFMAPDTAEVHPRRQIGWLKNTILEDGSLFLMVDKFYPNTDQQMVHRRVKPVERLESLTLQIGEMALVAFGEAYCDGEPQAAEALLFAESKALLLDVPVGAIVDVFSMESVYSRGPE